MLFLSCFLQFAWLLEIMLCDLFLLFPVLSFLLRNMEKKVPSHVLFYCWTCLHLSLEIQRKKKYKATGTCKDKSHDYGAVRTNLMKLPSELQLWTNCKNPIVAVSGSLTVSIPVCQAGILSGANCLHFSVTAAFSQNTGESSCVELPSTTCQSSVAGCYLGRYM